MESKSPIKLALSYGEERYMESPIKPDRRRADRPTAATLIRGERGIRNFTWLFHQLDVQAQRLQLANQDVKGLRHARFGCGFSFNDRFVDLGAPVDVVGLGGEQLLQHISRAVGFERPDFHFSETLSAKLRLAAEWLLRDEGVGTGGSSVDLVVDQVRELEHVYVAHGHGLFECLAGDAVP